MTKTLHSVTAQGAKHRTPWQFLAAALLMLFTLSVLMLPKAEAALQISDAELDSLVGRIALYPDDLVAIILPAATNPLQLVQADRFLQKRKANPELAVDEGWDDAVKSLLNYPDIVSMMSADLDWTSALGEAVVADQGAVLEGIQSFRRRTQSAGNLNSDDKQVIVIEKEVIKIVPADPEIIYVPQYEPDTVIVAGVAPVYGYYPTAYPSYYYPYAPGAALAAGIVWGAAMGAIWSGGRYVAHYGYGGGNNNINIDRNVNINTGNINTGNINRSGNTAWKSNKQPGQVSSSIGKNSSGNRVGDGSRSGAGGARPSTQPAANRGGERAESRGAAERGENFGGGDRGSDRDFGGGDRGGDRDFSGGDRGGDRDFGGGNRGGDAFGGYSSGHQARMDSSRGASSRSSMSGGSRGGGSARGGGGARGGRR
mgnify:CR=1 FL=1